MKASEARELYIDPVKRATPILNNIYSLIRSSASTNKFIIVIGSDFPYTYGHTIGLISPDVFKIVIDQLNDDGYTIEKLDFYQTIKIDWSV